MPPARQRTFLGSGDLPPEGRSDETIVPLQGELSRFQPVAKLAEGLSPVADRGLLSAVDFRKGAAVRRVEKDGVVAESMGPLRLGRDLSLNDAGRFVEDVAVVRERDVRHETRRARLEPARRQLAV